MADGTMVHQFGRCGLIHLPRLNHWLLKPHLFGTTSVRRLLRQSNSRNFRSVDRNKTEVDYHNIPMATLQSVRATLSHVAMLKDLA